MEIEATSCPNRISRLTNLTRILCFGILSAVGLLFISGCTTPTFTRPERTGIEQLLLTTAVDNALANLDLSSLRGKKVYLNDSYLDSYDVKYVKGAIRASISDSGAQLVDLPEAEVIVEPRCGGLGIDPSKSIFGLPSIPVPVPGSTVIETPELVLYGAEKNDSVTTIAILAYDLDGQQVLSTPAAIGKSYFYNYKILLLIDLNYTDIEARADY